MSAANLPTLPPLPPNAPSQLDDKVDTWQGTCTPLPPAYGVILEVFGSGTAPPGGSLDRFLQTFNVLYPGRIIVRTRVPHGTLNLRAYAQGDWLLQLPVIPAEDMTPECCYVKLLLALQSCPETSDTGTELAVSDFFGVSLVGEMGNGVHEKVEGMNLQPMLPNPKHEEVASEKDTVVSQDLQVSNDYGHSLTQIEAVKAAKKSSGAFDETLGHMLNWYEQSIEGLGEWLSQGELLPQRLFALLKSEDSDLSITYWSEMVRTSSSSSPVEVDVLFARRWVGEDSVYDNHRLQTCFVVWSSSQSWSDIDAYATDEAVREFIRRHVERPVASSAIGILRGRTARTAESFLRRSEVDSHSLRSLLSMGLARVRSLPETSPAAMWHRASVRDHAGELVFELSSNFVPQFFSVAGANCYSKWTPELGDKCLVFTPSTKFNAELEYMSGAVALPLERDIDFLLVHVVPSKLYGFGRIQLAGGTFLPVYLDFGKAGRVGERGMGRLQLQPDGLPRLVVAMT